MIDPTSRELLDLTVDRVRHLPVLLSITFRPEFQPPWSGRSHVTSLALNRLGEREGEALVHKLAGNAALAADIVAEIVERTDGVPLFVEELTKAVLESADQGGQVAAVLATTSLAALSVPATLYASLMARLDRLGPAAKEVAQIGAVLGREFAYELIELVAQRDESELQAALVSSTMRDCVVCRGTAPHSSYLFKHALVQDTACGTLLRGKRQELHARVAAVLERNFADLVERRPELLRASSDRRRRNRACDRSMAEGWPICHRAAGASEAIRHFDRGLAAIAALSGRPGPRRTGARAAIGPRPVAVHRRGSGAAEAPQAHTRARELAEQRGDPRQLFMAVYGLWQSANGAGSIVDCRKLSNRLQRLTADDADDELRLQAHHSAWATCMFAGDPAATRDHCEAGRQLYDPERHRLHRQLYGGHDPGMCADNFAAQAHWLLGFSEQSLVLGNHALALAERIAHPFSFAIALQFYAMLHVERESWNWHCNGCSGRGARRRTTFWLRPGAAAATRCRPDGAGRIRGGCRLSARGTGQPDRCDADAMLRVSPVGQRVSTPG